MNSLSRFRMYGAFCASVLVLAACGGGGGGGSDSPVAAAPSPALSPAANSTSSDPVQTVVNYALGVTIAGSGAITAVPTTGNSTTCSANCSASYPASTSVNIAATPGSGYQFSSWGGDCTGSGTCSVTMTRASNVTATFTQVTHAVGVTITGSGSVSVAAPPASATACAAPGCSNTYNEGASVTLAATPTSGYQFSGWSGACSGSTSSCTVAVSRALNVTATFAVIPPPPPPPVTYALNLTFAGSGSVTSTVSGNSTSCSATCSTAYAPSTSVTLAATPASGFRFTGWSGDCTGTSTCTVAMSRISNATATFSVIPSTINAPTPMGPLFPTVETSGVLPITVNCSADAAGVRKVAFGVPFPRGFLTSLSKVRLETEQGVEVAADTAELARWRHMSDTSIDGKSIRSVLVVFNQTCTNSGVFKYNIRWGSSDKTLTANTGITAANVYTTWRAQAPVVTGENVATDNYSRDTAAAPIYEPYAWVGLPANWLMKTNLRGPVSPIADNGTFALKTWLLGFNKTFVNDVASDVTVYEDEAGGTPGMIDWSKEYEGWLFDRPFALWNVYVQTGDPKWLRHAHRATQYYQILDHER
ncbi:MAG: InlB B-repeat-containing protein [Aquabacterium sp.]